MLWAARLLAAALLTGGADAGDCDGDCLGGPSSGYCDSKSRDVDT